MGASRLLGHRLCRVSQCVALSARTLPQAGNASKVLGQTQLTFSIKGHNVHVLASQATGSRPQPLGMALVAPEQPQALGT